jgi:hypothetical protein
MKIFQLLLFVFPSAKLDIPQNFWPAPLELFAGTPGTGNEILGIWSSG